MRPNIIQIVVDDMGVGDLSAFNKQRSQTYRLDFLMEEGVACAQQYSSSAVCMPARASLMTGLYPQRVGTVDYPHHRPWDYCDPQVLTLPAHLAANGYQTGCLGKWHLGSGPMHPARRGFDETLTFEGSMSDYWSWTLHYNGLVPKPADGRYLTDVLTDEAVSYVCRHRNEPFYLYLAYNAPHTPYQAHEEDVDFFRKAGLFNESVCQLYAMLRAVDRGIERILDTLDRLGLSENTLVWFTSDNGAVQNDRMRRSNGNMRGGKCSVWEGGIRVPSIVRWPAGGIAGGRICDDLLHFTDLPVTLCEAAEAPWAERTDGRNVLGALQGKAEQAAPKRFWQWTHFGVQPMHNAAVRDGKWKLVSPACGGYVVNAPSQDLFGLDSQMLANTEDAADSGVPLPAGFADHAAYRDYLFETLQAPRPDVKNYPPLKTELFDLEVDPAENNDLSEQHPEIADRLRHDLEGWFAEVMPEAESHRAADPYGVLAQTEGAPGQT